MVILVIRIIPFPVQPSFVHSRSFVKNKSTVH